jgi:hypothetical protein
LLLLLSPQASPARKKVPPRAAIPEMLWIDRKPAEVPMSEHDELFFAKAYPSELGCANPQMRSTCCRTSAIWERVTSLKL